VVFALKTPNPSRHIKTISTHTTPKITHLVIVTHVNFGFTLTWFVLVMTRLCVFNIISPIFMCVFVFFLLCCFCFASSCLFKNIYLIIVPIFKNPVFFKFKKKLINVRILFFFFTTTQSCGFKSSTPTRGQYNA
jgi:hypothetical protein